MLCMQYTVYVDSLYVNLLVYMFDSTEYVRVACNQSGVSQVVKVASLSSEDGNLSMQNLKKGGQVLWEENGRTYDATILSELKDRKGDFSGKKRPSKMEAQNKENFEHSGSDKAPQIGKIKKSVATHRKLDEKKQESRLQLIQEEAKKEVLNTMHGHALQ